jgi:hypothetical protein
MLWLLVTAATTPLPAVRTDPVGSIVWTAPPGSSKPYLTRNGRGDLLLTWFEPRPGQRYALRATRTRGGRWEEPRTIAESDRFFVNWADFPSIVETSGGSLVVHWLEKTADQPYAYHVRLSRSADQGLTWSPAITAHLDRSPGEHGFVAMVPDTEDGVAIAWLDGGAMAAEKGGAMNVRVATLAADGTMRGELVLDDRTCECCQVAMTQTRAGLVAAYRDRSPEEVRDIAIVRQVEGRWTAPAIIARDNWVWKACPVNGPSISASGDALGAAWFTGSGRNQVKVAFSRDGGASFGSPITVDEGDPLGRVHLQLIEPGRGVVTWLEAAGDGAEWRVRRVSASGVAGRPITLGRTSRTRDAGFPRTAVVGSDLFLAWTDPGSGPSQSQVRVTRVPLPR